MLTERQPLDLAAAVQELAPEHGHLLLAVSGGADSVALLRLAQTSDLSFEVATVDHGLRPESPEDVEFVRQLGAQLAVPVHTTRIDVCSIAAERNWNLEDAARRLRYSYLTRTARQIGASHLLVAHSQDDQAETVLLQLLRGAAWLRGMPARRGRILRPLLEITRQRLTAYLNELAQDWREDASNQDRSFERAWLRHEILPALRIRHPNVAERLAQLASLQRNQSEFLHAAAERLNEDGVIPVELLAQQHPALQREALAVLLRQAGRPVSAERLERARTALNHVTPWRESLGEGLTLRVAYGQVAVVPEVQPPASVQLVTDAADLPAEVSVSALGYPDLQLRSRRPGDRIRLAGGSKKLSDLLIDRKVPREERDALRVLASGQDLLWVERIAVAPEVSAAGPDPDAADARFMRLALKQAEAAALHGELPVGAIIVKDGVVISEAHNGTEAAGDPSAHAELLAVRRAAARLGDWRLNGCTLYVTLEPCPMCFGALQQAHLPEVVYGATNLREGALGGVADLNALPWKRKLTVRRGPFAAQAAEQLSVFFATRRTPHGKHDPQ